MTDIPKNQRCQDKFSHSFLGGACEWCGISQTELSEKKIEKIKPKIIKKKNITSETQLATDDLITYLGVPVKEFPRFARYVKKLGVKNIHGIIKQIKSVDIWCREKNGKALNKIGYFINNWITKKNK